MDSSFTLCSNESGPFPSLPQITSTPVRSFIRQSPLNLAIRNNYSISDDGNYHKLNINAYADVTSPGFVKRVIQYNDETTTTTSRSTHQNKYNQPGIFPIVHLFKKKTPPVKLRDSKVTVRIGSKIDLIPSSTTEIAGRLEKITQPRLVSNKSSSPQSVLTALKEISRKRIHVNELNESVTIDHSSSKKMKTNCAPSNGISDEYSLKKLFHFNDEIMASKSSMLMDIERKPVPQLTTNNIKDKPAKIITSTNTTVDVETQTLFTECKMTNTDKIPTEEHSTDMLDKSIGKDISTASILHQDKVLESVRQNRLHTILEKCREPYLKPILSNVKTFPNEKDAQTKHVTFNLPTSQLEGVARSTSTVITSSPAMLEKKNEVETNKMKSPQEMNSIKVAGGFKFDLNAFKAAAPTTSTTTSFNFGNVTTSMTTAVGQVTTKIPTEKKTQLTPEVTTAINVPKTTSSMFNFESSKLSFNRSPTAKSNLDGIFSTNNLPPASIGTIDSTLLSSNTISSTNAILVTPTNTSVAVMNQINSSVQQSSSITTVTTNALFQVGNYTTTTTSVTYNNNNTTTISFTGGLPITSTIGNNLASGGFANAITTTAAAVPTIAITTTTPTTTSTPIFQFGSGLSGTSNSFSPITTTIASGFHFEPAKITGGNNNTTFSFGNPTNTTTPILFPNHGSNHVITTSNTVTKRTGGNPSGFLFNNSNNTPFGTAPTTVFQFGSASSNTTTNNDNNNPLSTNSSSTFTFGSGSGNVESLTTKPFTFTGATTINNNMLSTPTPTFGVSGNNTFGTVLQSPQQFGVFNIGSSSYRSTIGNTMKSRHHSLRTKKRA